MNCKVAHRNTARWRRRFVAIADSNGVTYWALLKQDVVGIILQYGKPDPSAFVASCVLALSQVLGGPDCFCDALRWLANDVRLGRRSTTIEVSIMYWAGEHDISIGG